MLLAQMVMIMGEIETLTHAGERETLPTNLTHVHAMHLKWEP